MVAVRVHARSKSGFVPDAQLIFKAGSATGDYHGQLSYNNLQKWLKEKLIPNIPPKSVIYLHNVACNMKVLNPVSKQYAAKIIICDSFKKEKN